MAEQPGNSNDKVPFGQKILDRPFVLLALGMLVMAVFYTLWGIAEIVMMPTAQLP